MFIENASVTVFALTLHISKFIISIRLEYSYEMQFFYNLEKEFLIVYIFSDENTSTIESNSLQRHRDIDSTDRRSFFRTCAISGNESLYFLCVQSKRTRLLAYKEHILSAYQLSILSPLIINNLLPCDLFFQISSHPQKVRLNPYKSHREHTLNIGQAIDIVFATDLYHMIKPLHVPSINDLNLMKFHHQRVAFYDSIERVLLVDVTIVCSIRHRLKISVSVPYVLLNKSGMCLFVLI